MKRTLFSQTGFTTIQLVLVVGIIGILTAIAVPDMQGWLKTTRLDGAAREMLGSFNLARLEAVKSNGSATLSVNVAGDAFNVTAGGETVRLKAMPPGIDLVSSSFAAVTFDSKGIPDTVGSIVLSNGTTTRTLSLNTAGSVSLQ